MFCKYFAQGSCRNGSSCRFIHQDATKPLEHPNAVSFPVKEQDDPLSDSAIGNKGTVCRFFAQGGCRRASDCHFLHLSSPLPTQDMRPTAAVPVSGQTNQKSERTLSDSRAKVPCKFVFIPGGCQRALCPYSHSVDQSAVQKSDTTGSHEEEASSSANSCFHANNEGRTKRMITNSLAISSERWSASTN